jgi:hypothetical protein
LASSARPKMMRLLQLITQPRAGEGEGKFSGKLGKGKFYHAAARA